MNRVFERPLRVAVLSTHPIQYQVPLWRQLGLRENLQIRVYFGSDLSVRGYHDDGFGVDVRWDVPLTEGYTHILLTRDSRLQRLNFWKPRATGILHHLREFKPDVVLLLAYNSLFWIEGLLAARWLNVPVVMRHEASDAAVSRSKLKGYVRDQILRLFYSQIARFAAIGTRAREHLLRLNIPTGNIGWSPYCVDTEQIDKQVTVWLPRRQELRAGIGIGPDDIALIFSGKLIAKKQPLLILAAVERMPPELKKRIHLVVMGDGELKSELEQKGRALFGPRLHMTGFVNQSEMGRWYAVADCLVLPSKKGAGETWGLVVNEALQFGLPVIVSDGVGCGIDLVLENETGWIVAGDSEADYADVIRKLTTLSAQEIRSIRARCRAQVDKFSLEKATEGLVECFEYLQIR